MRVKIRKLSSFAALIFLCAFMVQPSAFATVTQLASDSETDIAIRDVATVIGDNSVCYPQLEGMADTALQQQINDTIVNDANIAQRLAVLSTLQAGGKGLQVTYTAYLDNRLFSVVIIAKGMLEAYRSEQEYTALCFDLSSGARLTLADLFIDPDAAVAWMETQLTDSYVDELSPYLEHADVTPLPVDSFFFDQNGITFYYPYDQFTLLSGYAGSVQFYYGELQDYLISDAQSVPVRLGAILPGYTDTQIRENILSIVAQGTLPYLTVYLDDPLPDLIAAYRLDHTPDQYPGGRYFQLEAPAYRDMLILSDALTDQWDTSVVEGILAFRMNLYGIQTGVTPRERWRQILGDPTASVYYDSSIAADYGLPVGTADYYLIDNRQLMLYADENDILYAVRLAK